MGHRQSVGQRLNQRQDAVSELCAFCLDNFDPRLDSAARNLAALVVFAFHAGEIVDRLTQETQPMADNMTNTNNMQPSDADVQAIDQLRSFYAQLQAELGKVIIGQEKVIEQTVMAILGRGHALLMGVPGLAKTLLVRSISQTMNLKFNRIQFTPDLMPADILGSEVLEDSESGRRAFRFISGPVFCQLLMADEINRASPRTQSALLQAMQEHRVSVAGHYHRLPSPFHVLATQNPLEQEGTYPLPEAQLDRFFMQVDVGYPDIDAERQIMVATSGPTHETPRQIMDAETLLQAQRTIRHVPVGESVIEAILNLVRAGRPESSPIAEVRNHVAWGPGPRASQALMQAVRARAVIDGRLAPSVDDVLALARPVLRHRMALNFAARAEGVSIGQIIDMLCARIV
jgi:MoxR-like ATPase